MEIQKNGKIITITGPSGVGRGIVVTLLKSLYPNFAEAVEVTTRAPRPGEIDGKHYYFVSKEHFEKGIRNNRYISWGQYAGNYYGLHKTTITQMLNEGLNVIIEVPLERDINILKVLYPNVLSVYIIPPSADSLVRRLLAREHNDLDRIQSRLNVYEAEAYAALKADAILVNEYSEETARTIVKIVEDPECAKQYYEDCVELVVQLKKALKEYKSNSRFSIEDGCILKYTDDKEELHTVDIPKGVKSIGAEVFAQCEYLTSISIPNSVTSIGNGAFRDCECLREITIPRSVQTIGEEAFMGCGELSKIRLPINILRISSGLFRGCTALSRIQIFDRVTEIGEEAFDGCTSLSNISVPDSVTWIGQFAFSSCSSLISFNLPMKLESISKGMFLNCHNLTEINLPKTIKTIGEQAFDRCRRLTHVVIPEGTIELGGWAFVDCVGLRDVRFLSKETEIGEYAFENCIGLSTICLPKNLSSIREGTFKGCTGLENIEFPSHIKRIGKYCFESCLRLKNIVIPSSVTTIEQGAFMDCRGLISVELPESVVSIEDHVFDGCYALKLIVAPGSFAEQYAKETGIAFAYSETSLNVDLQEEFRRLGAQLDDVRVEISREVGYVRAEVGNVGTAVGNIEVKLDWLIHFVKTDLQAWLQREKTRLEQSGLRDSEDAIAESVSKSNAYIQQKVSGATQLIEDETKRLSAIFGTTWLRLPFDTRTALISAGVLWDSCAGIKDDQNFDYSGICIATTSALENALKSVFYTGFQEHLLKTYGCLDKMEITEIYKHWPKELLDKKQRTAKRKKVNSDKIKPGNYFTMGTLPHLFFKEDNENIRKEMEKYLRTIVKKPENAPENWYAIDMLDLFINGERDPNSFVSRCEYVKTSYRDPAAHSGIIVREKAEACSDAIIGRTEVFNHNAKVYGLIMQLYDFLI